MPYSTHRRWWTVADAAQMLRVHTDTLYDACASGDFPHERWDGGQIRIPCEALRMTYVPDEATLVLSRRLARHTHVLGDVDQLALDLPPSMLIEVRLYRNGERKRAHDYERRLWGHNKPQDMRSKAV